MMEPGFELMLTPDPVLLSAVSMFSNIFDGDPQ